MNITTLAVATALTTSTMTNTATSASGNSEFGSVCIEGLSFAYVEKTNNRGGVGIAQIYKENSEGTLVTVPCEIIVSTEPSSEDGNKSRSSINRRGRYD